MTESTTTADGSDASTADIPVDTPVVVGDDIAVSCSNRQCDAQTRLPSEIDGRSGEPAGDDWTLTLVRDDGALVIHEAYCPDHRLGPAIDELAQTQATFADNHHEALVQVDQMLDT